MMIAKQEKTNNTEWKKRFDKNNRPHNSNNGMLGFWEDFWTDETLKLFGDFSNELSKKYGLDLTHINYSVAHGWKFKYSKSGVILVKNVYIFDDCFGIDEIVIKSREDYEKAIAHVDSLYTDDFLHEYEEKRLKRNAKQSERGKRLMARRKEELNNVLESIEPEKLNKFKWSPCVSRHSIKRLYNLNAKLIYDEELADEVGYTMYARCLQGRDETTLNYSGKLLCHNCKKVHISPSNGVILCSCGYAYIFHEYRKSFQKARMPSGAATPFFNEFISKWEKAKTYHDKMLAIDYVIHECHLNMISNVKRGFAGCNLIQGNKKQVSKLILDLAYN